MFYFTEHMIQGVKEIIFLSGIIHCLSLYSQRVSFRYETVTKKLTQLKEFNIIREFTDVNMKQF